MVHPKSTTAPGRAGLPMAQSSSPGWPGGLGETLWPHRPARRRPSTIGEVSAAQIKSFQVGMWPLFSLPTFPHCTFPPFELFLGYWSGIATHQRWPSFGWKRLWVKFLRCCRNPALSLIARTSHVSSVRCSLLGCRFKADEIATRHQQITTPRLGALVQGAK